MPIHERGVEDRHGQIEPDPRSIAETTVLDHALVEFAMPKATTDEVVRECLAKVFVVLDIDGIPRN